MMEWKRDIDLAFCSLLMIFLAISSISLKDGSQIRFLLAIPGLFFIPGYLFLSVLWPGGGMPLEEKVAISVSMSLILDVAAGLALSFLAWISLKTVVATLTALSLSMVVMVDLLRNRYAGEKTVEADDKEGGEPARGGIITNLPVVLLVFALIASAAAVTPYYIRGQNTEREYTELYFLDMNRTANDLPKEIDLNETVRVITGIHCMEGEETEYGLHIWLSNETYGNNGTVNITLAEETFTLQDSQTREVNISFSPVTIEASIANGSNRTTIMNGPYIIGASLDIGNDGSIDNTIWLTVRITS